MRGVWMKGFLTKESAIEKTNHSENLPYPLFALRARGPLGPAAKEGEFLPFVKLACRRAGEAGEERRDLISGV